MILRTLLALLLVIMNLDCSSREKGGGKSEGSNSLSPERQAPPQGGQGPSFPSGGQGYSGPDGNPQSRQGYPFPAAGNSLNYQGSPAAPVASPYGGRERIYKGLPQSSRKNPAGTPPSSIGNRYKMPSGYTPGPAAPSYSGGGGEITQGEKPRVGESRADYEARIRESQPHGPNQYEPPVSPVPVPRSKNPGTVRRTQSAPAIDKAMSRLEPGYEQAAAKPSQLRVEFRSAETKMQQALEQRDYQKISTEAQGVKTRAASLPGRLRDLPLKERLEVKSIMQMYDQGTEMIDEGQKAQEDAKVQMGIQLIGKATENLEKLEKQ